ncbi:MAG: hypothetical protein AAF456_15735 [Planctomycetota bacterium]
MPQISSCRTGLRKFVPGALNHVVIAVTCLAVTCLIVTGCNQHRYEPANWRTKVDSTLPGEATAETVGASESQHRSAASYFNGGTSMPGRGNTMPGRGGTLPARASTLPGRDSTLPARGWQPGGSTLPGRFGTGISAGSSLPARGAGVGAGSTTLPARQNPGLRELPGRLPGSTLPQRDIYPGGRLQQLPPIRRGGTLPQ